MKKKLLTLGLALTLMVSMTACGSTAQVESASAPAEEVAIDTTVYVSAAASMTESLDKVIALYEEENPNVEVIATYDSSGTLETQIQSGADCDVFISAAQKQMNELDETSEAFASEENFVLQGTRVNILENKCVLVASEDSAITDWDTFQAAITSAQSSSDLIFAMGNSDVPVGKYTSAILKNLGLDEAAMVEAGIVSYGSNVKEVTEQVSSGAADCGIIYATDAYSAGMTALAEADTELTDGPVIYPAAVMQNSANPEAAQAFLDFLFTDEAMAEFTAVGFTPVDAE